MYSEKAFNWLIATAVLLMLAIPVGFANLYLGFYLGESPSALCWFERIGLIVVGILGIFMLRYGPRLSYIALINIFAIFGIWMGFRHSLPHFSNDIGMGNGVLLFGAHAYTWIIGIYGLIILFMAFMLFLITRRSSLLAQLASSKPPIKKLSLYSKFVAVFCLFVVLSNAVQALYVNGLPPNSGKSSPNRFTLNYGEMSKTHTTSLWDGLRHFSFTGKNSIADPYIQDLSDPEDVTIVTSFINGAVAEAPILEKTAEKPITLYEVAKHTDAPILSVARNEQNGELAFVTDELGVFFTDPEATTVNGFVVFDKVNGADMKYVAGSAYSGDRFLFIAHNKTLDGVRKSSADVDPIEEFTTFTKTTGGFAPVFGKDRKLLRSIRGEHSYVNSLACDGRYLYTITLPNEWTQKVILQKYDTDDWTLSSETLLHPSQDLSLKEGRDFNDYYVTGMTYFEGKLLAISPQYRSLLFINPNTAEVEKVFELQGLTAPRSLFVRDDLINVLDRKEGRDFLVQIALPVEKSDTNDLQKEEDEEEIEGPGNNTEPLDSFEPTGEVSAADKAEPSS